jgi:hypothetical protein
MKSSKGLVIRVGAATICQRVSVREKIVFFQTRSKETVKFLHIDAGNLIVKLLQTAAAQQRRTVESSHYGETGDAFEK